MNDKVKKHVLIVDDEQSIRELVRDILEEEGYYVTAVANGIEALEALGTEDVVDLIISDIRMPVMSGIKLLEKIREQNAFPPPMIFITGYSDINQDQALEKGVVAYLKKPMSINELLTAVENSFQAPQKFKRVHPRVISHLSVNFVFKKNNETINAQVCNVGRGGVFIASDKLGSIGDLISFQILFNETEVKMVVGEGEIVWQRTERNGKYLVGIGVRFVSISLEDEQFISDYVDCRRNQVQSIF